MISSGTDRLIIFARFPQPGRAKTRLIPAVGPERAAAIQRQLTRGTLALAQRFAARQGCEVEVRFSDGTSEQMLDLYGARWANCRPQTEGDLGERLEQAVATAFAEGAGRVVVIGTDCPELDESHLDSAFQGLQVAEVAIGPAYDGGYYLIGMRRDIPGIFRGIDWSTPRVLEQTLVHCRRTQCRVRQLVPLADIDHPEDLLILRRLRGEIGAELPQRVPGMLTVVIPALNEEQNLRPLFEYLKASDRLEVIVADGGSDDGTAQVACDLGATVIRSQRGRGRQMNAGAALARGETLLFLHADSALPKDYRQTIEAILAGGALAGAFCLSIAGPERGLRWVEWGANLRSRLRRLPYGDQGLFLRSEDFYRLGGFRNWPLLEDYEFVKRLKRSGRIEIADAELVTSPRRWRKRGILRTTVWNQFCLAAYHCGVSPERIARWYQSGGISRESR